MERILLWRTGFLTTRESTARRLVIGGFLVLVFHWLFIFSLIFPRLGTLQFFRLHSTALIGVNWVDVWWKIFLFPAVGAVAFFVNLIFSAILMQKIRLLGIIVLSANLILEILFAIGGIFVILLNS